MEATINAKGNKDIRIGSSSNRYNEVLESYPKCMYETVEVELFASSMFHANYPNMLR